MERWLLFIPVVKNPVVLSECVNQLMYKRNIDLIILLNGADQEVKDLVRTTYSQYPQIIIWENEVNVYVTQAWNSAIKYFKNHSYWDRLFIINSDLTMQSDWDMIIREAWEQVPNLVITPTTITDKTKMFEHIPIELGAVKHLDNPPGIFITLNHEQAELVFPIPNEIRIWYNDSYLYQLLKASGYHIVTLSNLLAFHHVSTTIKDSEWAHNIIQEDKRSWINIVEPLLQEKIKRIKNDNQRIKE